MEEANARQVGGTHYAAEYQHWDLVEDIGLGYLECQATRYIARWRKKNGLEDLRKADHYVEKLLERGRTNRVYWDKVQPRLNNFLLANIPNSTDAVLFTLLVTWDRHADLVLCRNMIDELIKGNFHADGTPITDSNRHAR